MNSILKAIMVLSLGCTTTIRSKKLVPSQINIPDVRSSLYKDIKFSSDVLYLDLQENFRNTPVDIKYKGQTVFSKVVTSDDSTGFAESTKVTVSDEKNVLELNIDGIQLEIVILFSLGQFIGLKMQNGELVVEQSKNPFFYD